MQEAIDVSFYQGVIRWNEVTQPIAIVKMSGGDLGLYYDPKANANYYGSKAAGKDVGCYHFAGATDPVEEAQFFLRACTPLEENDVLVLDWEVRHSDPVSWCNTFANYVHDQTGVWVLIYMNQSTLNSYDWTPVLQNCGLWIAAPSYSPSETVPIAHTYVMHQYGSPSNVAGVDGACDVDMFFGSREQFRAYGYHAAQPAPEPTPIPVEPVPEPVPDPVPTPVDPVPIPLPEPVPQPEPSPTPVPSPIPDPPVTPTPSVRNWLQVLLDFIFSLFKRK